MLRGDHRFARRALFPVCVGALALVLVVAVPSASARTPSERPGPSLAPADTPVTDNALGPIENVTAAWRFYQPAADFCVTPDVYEFPAFTPKPCAVTVGRTVTPEGTLSDPGTHTTGTYDVRIDTPALCARCARLFIDYSRIGANDGAVRSAHGHAYFRLMSFNASYTADPVSHSPNIKNLTNDYLVAPPGSPSSAATRQLDPHLLTYAADTANTAHDDAQGPYYAGPGYFNTAGDWIDGAYVDVDLSNAHELGHKALDAVAYGATFDSDPSGCIDARVGGPSYRDGNYFYGGCVDWAGGSEPQGVSPWPDDR